jgi:branched-chain amino acid transport system permease protein
MAGAGGTFYAQKYLYVDPTIAYGVEKSVEMLLVTMIGGAGTVFGPLIGAVVLGLLSEVTRLLSQGQGLSLIVYGAILIVIVAYLPNGLMGLFARRAKPGSA